MGENDQPIDQVMLQRGPDDAERWIRANGLKIHSRLKLAAKERRAVQPVHVPGVRSVPTGRYRPANPRRTPVNSRAPYEFSDFLVGYHDPIAETPRSAELREYPV